jgi:AAA+ ATPase superfamily predicted ATPase
MDSFEIELKNKTICIVAKRNSGKTYLARRIIEHKKGEFDAIFLFSPTEKVKNDYKGLVKAQNIFDTWSDSWAELLFERLSQKKRNVLLLLDDMGSESSLENSKMLIRCFTRGRHLGLGVVFLAQYIYQLPKIARSNLDYVICGMQNENSIQILEEEFNTMLEPKAFRETYKKATKNYHFLVINCTSVKDNADEDQIYATISADDI